MTRSGYHGTTILCVRRDGEVCLGGDGQVSIADTVVKSKATKVRTLKGGKVLAGFAGSVADALTLFEKFEEKLDRYPGNLQRAAVELAKDWRSDRILRHLEALLCLADDVAIELGDDLARGQLLEPGRRHRRLALGRGNGRGIVRGGHRAGNSTRVRLRLVNTQMSAAISSERRTTSRAGSSVSAYSARAAARA